MTVHVASARIRAIVHATEDPNKIIRALFRVCPQDKFQPRIEKTVLKGHFGNPITTVTFAISGRQAESFFSDLWTMLSSEDRETLAEGMSSQLDDQGGLHLRLDKQGCFLGTMELKDQDPVKVEVGFRGLSDPAPQIRGFLRSIEEAPPGSNRTILK